MALLVGDWSILIEYFDIEDQVVYAGESTTTVIQNETTMVSIVLEQNTGYLFLQLDSINDMAEEIMVNISRGTNTILSRSYETTGTVLYIPVVLQPGDYDVELNGLNNNGVIIQSAVIKSVTMAKNSNEI